jgi:hypothetical protein
MPLVISLRADQDFYVGDEQLLIGEIHSPRSFQVIHAASGKVFEIDDSRAVEVLPDVLLSSGDQALSNTARVVIDAPRNLLVVRGDAYRNPPPSATRRGRA